MAGLIGGGLWIARKVKDRIKPKSINPSYSRKVYGKYDMRFLRWLLLIPIILLILFVGFTIWAYTPLGPMPEALSALQSNTFVQVTEGPWIVFEPTGNMVDTGLIIYPGGRVDPRSYAPIAQQLSAEGYLVAIVPMPFNLAVFGSGRASDIINGFPEVNKWVIAGHSLGGTMAARYSLQHPEKVQRLALWASYPAASDDLSQSSIPSASIYGTLDGLTSLQDIENSRQFLPQDTLWVPINGGNHAQFGWYGDQPGDNPANISRETQQKIISETMITILQDTNK